MNRLSFLGENCCPGKSTEMLNLSDLVIDRIEGFYG